MKTSRQWKAPWNGHTIRVEHQSNAWGFGQTSAFVDGICAHRVEGQIYRDLANVESEFEDESGTHRLRIKVAASTRKICHIFVDDELIGGDTDKKIPRTEAEIAALPIDEQRKLLKHQLFRMAVVAPAFLIPLHYGMVIYLDLHNPVLTFGQIPALIIPQILRIKRKLRELPSETDTSNSTIV